MTDILEALYRANAASHLPPFVSEAVRLAGAVLGGACLGWQREFRSTSSAGFRTFILVSVGSCLFAMIGRELGGAEIQARVIAQVISGVGFLGAGAVLQLKDRVVGLTTAASIWVCSALGMIFGLGFVLFGLCMTLLVFVILSISLTPRSNSKEVPIEFK